jgi:predicted GIY-YIG superfamily endonuclease
MTCDTKNEIYLGESIALRARLALHKSHIASPQLRVQNVSSQLET